MPEAGRLGADRVDVLGGQHGGAGTAEHQDEGAEELGTESRSQPHVTLQIGS